MSQGVEADIDDAIEASVDPKARDSQIVQMYESDTGELRRVFELGQYRAEVKYLDHWDDFHVLIVGPDALHGYERHGKVWSMTYENLAGAVEGAKEQLKKHKDRFDRRTGGRPPTPEIETAETDGGVEASIGTAAEAAVEPQQGRERVGNTRFVATDGVGGMARVSHEDMPIGVDVSPRFVRVFSRVDGMEIEVDHKPEQRPTWRGGDESFGG